MLENSEFQGKQSTNYKEINTSEETKSKQNNSETNNSDQSDENDMLSSNKSVAELETSGSHPSGNEAEITEEDGTMDSAGNIKALGETQKM